MKLEHYTIYDLKEKYDIDFEDIAKEIKAKKPKSVLLQFPDGLKPYATSVLDYLKKEFPKIEFILWLGTCFGACDLPPAQGKADLIIQFGHSPWKTN